MSDDTRALAPPTWLPVTAAALSGPLMADVVVGGALEMYRPRPNLIYSRAFGRCTTALAEGWIMNTATMWSSVDKLVVMNDWQLMTSYDSTARSSLTEWVLAHRQQFRAAWFSSGSRVVSMGISVAGVATSMFGVPMHAPGDRAVFLSELERELSS